jgi:hypothetical protein
VASARARKLALAADTFDGRVLYKPAGAGVAPRHAFIPAVARQRPGRTTSRERMSPASRRSDVCRTPGMTPSHAA